MKSYNNLCNKMFSDENIEEAAKNGGKNKYKNNSRHRKLRYIKKNSKQFIAIIKKWLKNYQVRPHKVIEINDGISAKKRNIIVPTYQEVIIHHAIINVIRPIFEKSMYQHSYASIPGRGIHKAMRQVKKWIKNDKKNTKYCLKMDIRKFFESIDQQILLKKLKRIIRDEEYFHYLEIVITTTDKGLPLGFTTSQWFANFILTELDHLIKEQWGAKYYLRFMDDMVIFGSNKRKLHQIKNKVQQYLKNELNLELKSNWQIFPLADNTSQKKGRFLDFLGFKFYRTHTGLRSSIALKAKRKAKRIYKKGKPNIRDARQMVTYGGFIRYADCYDWFQEYIKQFVNFRQLRKHISKYDRLQLKGG